MESRSVYMVRKDGKFYRNHASGFIQWGEMQGGQIFHQKAGASQAANRTGGQILEFVLDLSCALIK
jgi:hypothetical protein